MFTGDLADRAEPAAYEQLRGVVEPAAAAIGAEVVWVMGNHDERRAYAQGLFDSDDDGPQDRVHDVAGLRIVALDSSVPGWHHGELSDDQLAWLADVRGILGGHLHFTSYSTFAGVPVSVASATCYTSEVAPDQRLLVGVGAHQTFTMLHLYDDRVVHSVVAATDATEVSGYGLEMLEPFHAMSPEERFDMVSRKDSPLNARPDPVVGPPPAAS